MNTDLVQHLAPAKVNLWLHVTGRREDGFHLLDSLVIFVDIGDGVAVGPAHDLTFQVVGPFAQFVPTGPDNLVLRAARALADFCNIRAKAHIRLDKNLPVAAGIGGGSADAAAALKGLRDLWGLSVSDDQLAAIGLSLGADIPVCLRGKPVYMQGIGEILKAAPALPKFGILLVNPNQPLETPPVFKRFKVSGAPFTPANPLGRAPAHVDELVSWLKRRRNDLEAPARVLCPSVSAITSELAKDPACLLTRMSGSGATCFAIFSDLGRARAAAQRLQAKRPEWWIKAGQPIF